MIDLTLKELSSQILDLSEEIRDAVDQYKEGEITEEELSLLVSEVLRPGSSTSSSLQLKEPFEGKDLSPKDLLLKDSTSLHPLYAALLAERLQFDGDAPEFRTGPLPAGVAPAAPVKTEARDPVVIGLQLQRASDKVLGLIAEGIQSVLPPGEGELVVVPKEADPEIYRRGSLPVPVEVEDVKISEISLFEEEQRRNFAWKTISTTQGRRSSLQVIRDLVRKSLDRSRFHFVEDSNRGIETSYEWVFHMSHEGSLQNRFSFIDVCVRYFLNKMTPYKQGATYCIKTIDRISDREVGWRLDILE